MKRSTAGAFFLGIPLALAGGAATGSRENRRATMVPGAKPVRVADHEQDRGSIPGERAAGLSAERCRSSRRGADVRRRELASSSGDGVAFTPKVLT